MKIEIEPTDRIENVNGVPARLWKGKSDRGVPVWAWINTVQPQTHDLQQLADFDRDLRSIEAERQLTSSRNLQPAYG